MRNLALCSFLVPGGDVSSAAPLRTPRFDRDGAPDRLTHLSAYSSRLPGLSGPEQRALHLVEIEGASYREVGAQLGLGREDVKKLVCDTRRKLYGGIGSMLGALALGLGLGLA